MFQSVLTSSSQESASLYYTLFNYGLQKAGESEFELSDMRKEKEDPASKVAIYAMVDLDNQYVYALKVHRLTQT